MVLYPQRGVMELKNYRLLHLLKKLQNTPPLEIKNVRIRVPNYEKFGLLARSYVNYKLNLV